MPSPNPSPVIPKLALSREEAAVAIGVHPATVDRLTKRGLLRPSRATRRPIYAVCEIERFLRDTSGEIAPIFRPEPAHGASRANSKPGGRSPAGRKSQRKQPAREQS